MLKWSSLKIKLNVDNTNLMAHRECPICGCFANKNLLTLSGFQFFSDASFSKQVDLNEVQCRDCNAIYLNPCYSNAGFQRLFSEAGQSYGSTEIRPTEQVTWLEERGLLNPGDRVFDIGCGTGNFLSHIPQYVEKSGVDIDEPSIEVAKNTHPNIDFICSSFESLTYDKKVDVFTMYHVLEHLSNPRVTLERLYNLANDETTLVVEVPIIENGLTNDINGFFSAQHLTHFSRNSLKNMLAVSGWEIVEWIEMKDYNGCRVLTKKSKPDPKLQYTEIETFNAYKYLENWYRSIAIVEEKLNKITNQQCVVWGAGMHLEFMYQTTSLFDKSKANKFIIVDSDVSKQGKEWRGIPIYSPDILQNILEDYVLLISSYGGQEKIYQAAIDKSVESKNIVKLYDFLRVY